MMEHCSLSGIGSDKFKANLWSLRSMLFVKIGNVMQSSISIKMSCDNTYFNKKKEDKLIGTESDFVLSESITFNY